MKKRLWKPWDFSKINWFVIRVGYNFEKALKNATVIKGTSKTMQNEILDNMLTTGNLKWNKLNWMFSNSVWWVIIYF